MKITKSDFLTMFSQAAQPMFASATRTTGPPPVAPARPSPSPRRAWAAVVGSFSPPVAREQLRAARCNLFFCSALDLLSLALLMLQLQLPGSPGAPALYSDFYMSPTLTYADSLYVPVAIAMVFPVLFGGLLGAVAVCQWACWVYLLATSGWMVFRLWLVFEAAAHQGQADQWGLVYDVFGDSFAILIQMYAMFAAADLALLAWSFEVRSAHRGIAAPRADRGGWCGSAGGGPVQAVAVGTPLRGSWSGGAGERGGVQLAPDSRAAVAPVVGHMPVGLRL